MNPVVRLAGAADVEALIEMRALMFADMGVDTTGSDWLPAARTWFARAVDQPSICIVVVEQDDGLLLSCGMVELHAGPPGPMSPTGNTAHLSNLVTVRDARGRGYGSLCLKFLVKWATGKQIASNFMRAATARRPTVAWALHWLPTRRCA